MAHFKGACKFQRIITLYRIIPLSFSHKIKIFIHKPKEQIQETQTKQENNKQIKNHTSSAHQTYCINDHSNSQIGCLQAQSIRDLALKEGEFEYVAIADIEYTVSGQGKLRVVRTPHSLLRARLPNTWKTHHEFSLRSDTSRTDGLNS